MRFQKSNIFIFLFIFMIAETCFSDTSFIKNISITSYALGKNISLNILKIIPKQYPEKYSTAKGISDIDEIFDFWIEEIALTIKKPLIIVHKKITTIDSRKACFLAFKHRAEITYLLIFYEKKQCYYYSSEKSIIKKESMANVFQKLRAMYLENKFKTDSKNIIAHEKTAIVVSIDENFMSKKKETITNSYEQ